jgi:ketosteroid isomerase-like protein
MATTLTTNSVETIAKTLVEKCRQAKFEEVVQELYAPDVVTIESMEMPNFPKETKGLEAVVEKGKQWAANTEVHHMEVSEPLVAGSQFAVKFTMDMTCKQTNQRNTTEEIALYQVENGKIVKAHFLYDACQQA